MKSSSLRVTCSAGGMAVGREGEQGRSGRTGGP